MALAIFDARPSGVTVGSVFDTAKRYIYKDTTGAVGAAFIKYATGPTIVGSGANLTFAFDGASYTINSAVAVSGQYVVMGVN